MSLILRKNCQDVLDHFGLQEFHVSINDTIKNLDIISECGKPFVQITGIKFNRITPTAAEIEFATELLDAFLGTHAVLIKKYLAAMKTFKNKKEVKEKNKSCWINVNTPYRTDIRNYTGYYMDKMFKISFNEKLKITEIEFINDNNNPITTKQLTNYSFDNKLFKESCIHLKIYKVYNEEEENINSLKRQLSVCNV